MKKGKGVKNIVGGALLILVGLVVGGGITGIFDFFRGQGALYELIGTVFFIIGLIFLFRGIQSRFRA